MSKWKCVIGPKKFASVRFQLIPNAYFSRRLKLAAPFAPWLVCTPSFCEWMEICNLLKKNFASVLFQLITSRSKTSCFFASALFPALDSGDNIRPHFRLASTPSYCWVNGNLWFAKKCRSYTFSTNHKQIKTSSYLHARTFLRLKLAAPLGPPFWLVRVFMCFDKANH